MKCAPAVAHYYQDYRGARRATRYVEGYEVLLSRGEVPSRFIRALIAAAVAVERVARAPSARHYRGLYRHAVGERGIKSVLVLTFLLGDLTQPLIIPQRAAHRPDDLHRIGARDTRT